MFGWRVRDWQAGCGTVINRSQQRVEDRARAGGSFLVVWRDGRNNNNIYGIIFNEESAQGTTPFAIAQSQSNATIPDVAWNEASGMYLVTWQNNHLFVESSDIQGYRVAVSGNLIGSLTTMDNNPAVARPSLTVAADKWLITWQQGSNPEDLYGRFMFPDGSVGVEILPLVTSDAAQTVPAVIGGQPNGDYLLTWQDNRDEKAAIYSRLFSELSKQETTTTITYEYDPLYRLTGAVYSGDISASYEYAYDEVGNMEAYTETLTTDSGSETSILNRAFNDANQLTAATDTVLGTTSYYYDNNGNMVQILPPGVSAGEAGEQLYSFNQRNLLTGSSVGGGSGVYDTIATYDYDGNGRIKDLGEKINTTSI